MEIELKLPNGFTPDGGEQIATVTLRPINGHDEDFLRNTVEVTKGNALVNLLRRCTLKMGDVEDTKLFSKLYEDMLMADLTFLLVRLRQFSTGDEYAFTDKCGTCGHLGKYTSILSELLEVQQPEECRGQEFVELQVPGVGLIKFRQLLVRDTALMQQIQKMYKAEKATREMMIQLKAIDGQPVEPKALQGLASSQRNAIRAAIDAAVGGVDTELVIECANCGDAYVRGLPVKLKDFFFPGAVTTDCQMARPYRSSGTTLPSSEPNGAGSLTP